MSIRVERSEVHPSVPAAGGGGPSTGHAVAAGVLLVAGPLVWASSFLTMPDLGDDEVYAYDMATSVFFLLALAALASVMRAARATGTGKGRWLPLVPMVLAPFGIASSLGTLPYETYDAAPTWVAVTDPAWPLTQLAMLVCAVAVARVGRWHGPLRWLPLAGALWLPVVGAAQAALGEDGMAVVFTVWMAGTYAAAGALLCVRPGAARTR